MCEVASGFDGDEFHDVLDQPATERAVARLDAMASRLRVGEPLQYVLGRWGFRHLDLMVDQRVLIPRPETEMLVDIACELLVGETADRVTTAEPWLVADLGCGSGAIGLSLAAELPVGAATVWLTDHSADALDVARANAAGLGQRGAAVRFASGSWYEALPDELAGRFDMVCSNPPYVAVDDEVEQVVRDWEPHAALFADDGGMADIEAIVGDAQRWLRPGGWLVVEIGSSLGATAVALARSAGLADVAVRVDLAGHDRFLVARRPESGLG